MKLYALTGGIGSGKSTVLKLLEQKGIGIISSDSINAEVLNRPEVQKQIFDRFRTVDKAILRDIIFGDETARKDLEAILHPLVRDEMLSSLNEMSDKFETIVYESALVFEMNHEKLFEGVIVVECPADTRLLRLQSRPGMTESVAKRIIATQVSDLERWDRADFVIHNGNGAAFLEERVDRLIRQIQTHSSLPLLKDKKD